MREQEGRRACERLFVAGFGHCQWLRIPILSHQPPARVIMMLGVRWSRDSW